MSSRVIHSPLRYLTRRMAPNAHISCSTPPVSRTNSSATLARADISALRLSHSGSGAILSMPLSPGNAYCHVSPVCGCTWYVRLAMHTVPSSSTILMASAAFSVISSPNVYTNPCPLCPCVVGAGLNAALVNCARTLLPSCSPPGSSPPHSFLTGTPSPWSTRHVICQPHHRRPPAATLYLPFHPGSSHTALPGRIWIALSAPHGVPTSSLCCSCNTASPPHPVTHISTPPACLLCHSPFPLALPYTPSPVLALLEPLPIPPVVFCLAL